VGFWASLDAVEKRRKLPILAEIEPKTAGFPADMHGTDYTKAAPFQQ